MKVKNILETRLNIIEIKDIFCSDYDKNIMRLLKDKFVMRCFKSMYILDIIQIIRRSNMQCKNKVLDGSLYIDVSFEVSGIVYEKGDIVHNCKIIQIDNNNIMHAKSEYASLSIKNIIEVNVFKENDEIPVLVNMARYNIFDNEVSVSAIPLVPIIKKHAVYRVKTDEKNVEQNVKKLFNFRELEDNIAAVNKSGKNIFKFFRDLLYPFKKEVTHSGKKISISLNTLLMLNEDDLIYRPDSYLDSDECFLLTKSDNIIDIDKQDLILYLLNDYNKNLTLLIEFLETYNTPEKIKSKSSFWSLYKTFKK